MMVRTASLLLCLLLLGLALGRRENKREGEGEGQGRKKEEGGNGASATPALAKTRAETESESSKGQKKKEGTSGKVENAKRKGSDKVVKRVAVGDTTAKRARGGTASKRVETGTVAKRVESAVVPKRVGNATISRSQKKSSGPRGDAGCVAAGGICQRSSYVCQGRYLQDRCAGSPGRQCCMPVGAWDVLCAGHHHNRVRACDFFGCGSYNSASNGVVHKAVDIVCDDYGSINAPFSGTLGGPVGRRGEDGIQFDGVKLSNHAYCIKIFNIRPLRYSGPVTQGDTLGYQLPLQDSQSGITSHLELQMCDQSDPTPFI
ncbi:uncharacterized protein LOC134452560 [Engraulis encrasicolus]|uniref:uncharacterized protein LOC134452560 n=1 Tax=Engraulis encrasicolus TaxID=184585 RepID=UPI002FD76333